MAKMKTMLQEIADADLEMRDLQSLIEQGTGTDTKGFKYHDEEEREEDNRKTWHYITTPDGKEHTIDLGPYDDMSDKLYLKLVAYYKQNKKFPNKQQIIELS